MAFIITLCILIVVIFCLAVYPGIKRGNNEQIVKEINRCLRRMDNAQDMETVGNNYKAILQFMQKLPNDIKLNDMTLSQARDAVYNEYRENTERVKAIKSNFTYSSNTDCNIIDMGNGLIRAKWGFILDTYMKGHAIDDELLDRFIGHRENEYVEIPKRTLYEMESRLAKHIERENTINRTAELNNKGITLEKAGKIQEAIKIYEQNISYGDCRATHSYERLMVLYRRLKDYNNEKRIIELAIKMLPCNREKYEERLKKVNKLIEKNKNNKTK